MTTPTAGEIVAFWHALGPDRWFRADPALDAEIAQRFGAVRETAESGALDAWAATAEGALALLILLDQFPRNMFRGTKRAYATDAKARDVAGAALAAGLEQAVEPTLRQFFLLPLMHSEELADQERCVRLYAASDDAKGLAFARGHRDIVARFGRFPHRNAILGRASTAAEEAFLAEGGFRG